MMVFYILAATVATSGGRYVHGGSFALLAYLFAYVVLRYALSALYLMGRPNVSRAEKWKLFFVGTAAAVLLNVFLLMPTRYVALAKLFDNRWQTRELSAAQLAELSQPNHLSNTAPAVA
jgi:hypothetical protein